jgi:hypothetical protein
MADQLKSPRTFTKGIEIERVFHVGQDAEFAFGKGTALFAKAPVQIWGCTAARVVSDANEKWFEFGFRIDAALSGNGAAGWTDAGNYFKLEAQWSLDLVNWSMGKFIPAPVPVVDLGDGTFEYWSRCIHPQDAAVKSGQIECHSMTSWNTGIPGSFTGDSRNNPITALKVAGVALNLGGFPYTMATSGEDARMQADLRVFYPAATVVATSNLLWDIVIPGVNLTAYSQTSRVSWPVYLIADMFGVVNTPIDGADLVGNMVDAAGTAIYQKAFARLKISGGSRYDPYR